MWLIFESIKALEIKIPTLFNLDFAKDYFFIPANIAQVFNSIAELIILIGIPTKLAKAEIEAYPVTVKIKIKKWSI